MGDSAQSSFLARQESPAAVLGWLGVLLIGAYLLLGPRLELHAWRVEPETNAALEEAIQWKKGTLALEKNSYEVARIGERRFNVVGLAFTIISVIATTINNIAGGRPDEFFSVHYVLVAALPIPLAAFWALRRATGSSAHAALLSGYLLVGTSVEPILRTCKGGSIYYVNHALAVTGLFLLAGDLLGRRRIWPAVLGLLLAGWSRQMTALYALPLLWIAWRHRRAEGTESITSTSVETRHRLIAMAGIIVLLTIPMALSWAKFGNPLTSGYSRIYEGRTDAIGQRGLQSIFSADYVPMHLRAMTIAYPRWDVRGGAFYPLTDGLEGGGIWLASPLLLAVLVTIRQWWRDPVRRVLMAGTLPVIAGLCFYHTTGSLGAGHYRYALDFIPIWLTVIAPCLTGRRALPWVLACLAYGGLYFRLLP